jgi:hypothetical protein
LNKKESEIVAIVTQKNVRDRLIKLTEEGMMAKYVAKSTSIAESSLSKFKNGKYDLPHSELTYLSEWLLNRGY